MSEHECKKCRFNHGWKFCLVLLATGPFWFGGCEQIKHGFISYERRITALESKP